MRRTDQAKLSSAAALRAIFRRSGYVRRASAERQAREGWQEYKKGTEVRLVLKTEAELAEVRQLLRSTGLRLGRSFRKHSRFVQPVYGAAAVALFVADGADSPRRPAAR